ncbi:DUF4236 domain-containing protein (plasmid) [Pseudoalteromonas lipolytica]|jgi:hypothetical protein|uniref:DUF4236 domain-containing protein n=1 Tax=Pseudoalteromonas lipolytica TaxID=570156 RepID=A0AAD0S489_9GAMM|nr:MULTISPECIES: DUF4236 domain-containing protein [Pseudoalteromonas]KZY45364.1 hypothetical protein A3733_13795 [Pseudoalteromonas shioyasakiensis]MBD57875.1 DUF4236 domain-containing protein [Pseudoalteromonas sp.]AXV67730.1 DUF4236 domain-containing protein [Pseudoalteromonas donghaensis]KZY50509.1 hypothetical protein A3733_31400 [Pseudoalteromonas shioyasakiensis]MCF2850134.1 DUF4236 domain-containing protein [Pseudoalteromonas sp. PAST1]|tara:strand:+ start:12399 stop:12797 length:399 start_codon:yes stop_codon:yes gene_type:complete
MGFRKSIKVGKGVRVNIGKKGISSLSLGGKGLTLNASEKGIRATGSIPGSGISHAKVVYKPDGTSKHVNLKSSLPPQIDTDVRKVSFLLGMGIFFLPYIFAWYTLRKGHSTISRVTSFAWLFWLIYSVIQQP